MKGVSIPWNVLAAASVIEERAISPAPIMFVGKRSRHPLISGSRLPTSTSFMEGFQGDPREVANLYLSSSALSITWPT